MHKEKVKRGAVDRVVDNYSLIAKDLFEKDANVQTFIGKEVLIEALNISGKIEGSFGKSGKVRIMFQ